jgi:hypothetical protein
VWGLGFRVLGSGVRGRDLEASSPGCGVQGSGFRFRIQGSGDVLCAALSTLVDLSSVHPNP